MLRRVLASAPVLLLLAGCTAPEPAPRELVLDSADSCAALSDTFTLLANVSGLHERGGLSEGDFKGASRLATRLLGYVEYQPDTEIGELIAEAQEFAPSMAIIDPSEPPDFLSDEWYLIREELALACYEAGTPIEVAGWSGG